MTSRTSPALASLVTATQATLQEEKIRAPAAAVPILAAAHNSVAPTVVVLSNEHEAEHMVAACEGYIPSAAIASFPAWETLPHERLSPRADTVATRLATLRRVTHPEDVAPSPRVIVTTVRALMQPVVPTIGDYAPVTAHTGQERDLTSLARDLGAAAYSRVDMVERRGDFAVRGGIVDVFAPTDHHPVRIEFFGDQIESIRSFSIADQRSLESDTQPRLWAPPCREMALTADVRSRATSLVESMPHLEGMLTKISEGHAVEGMESLLPVLVDTLVSPVTLLPHGSRVVVVDPEKVERRAEDVTATAHEFAQAAWSAASAGAQAPITLETGGLLNLDEVKDAAELQHVEWTTVGLLGEGVETGFTSGIDIGNDLSSAMEILAGRLADQWQVVVLAAGTGSAERMREQCADADVPARVTSSVSAGFSGVIDIVPAVAGEGYVHEERRLLVLSERDLTGRRASVARPKQGIAAKRRGLVDPLQLNPGDMVVHDHHGVGRFVELASRTVRGTEREYLVIEYAPSRKGAPGDRLSVPTDQLDQVTKYAGGDRPSLHKMGGSDWAKTKGRARKAVKDIAAELIRLYSARQATKGRECGPDTPWQRELEESFSFVETPDQLSSIDEVKEDMEGRVPMDRLIAGDVGFGKTEIAVRAAFKAIQDGGQVALLCPTTLLVTQHLDTFRDRFAQFPVKVEALSRFQTASEARAVEEGLADGTIDMVIGTHRLLTGQVHFKDLALLIVDEEQRFGVEHKETLKAMRTNVDVLAMSATPIPRTLEMGVTGIRDMSTLATPPEERHPVLTYVGPHDNAQIAAAIRRELLRDGQVFYIHNTVSSITRAAARIEELVPEARVAVAHGQMSESALEATIADYYDRKIDVLVCTTIVETGLDITNANTLIVERSDAFGLSQLHQLRGRVGRGRERAYAYFFYPADRTLNETAHDRLATIAAHSELGSGMAVAMKDLEIRGAGNLLGGEQSGHIEGVGFDLYVRMVSDAVAKFRGEEPERAPVTIELPVDAHIPVAYIDSERLRLEAYRTLAESTEAAQIDAIAREWEDRYGPIPQEVEDLLVIARVRIDVRSAGVEDVVHQGRMVRFHPVELAESATLRMRRLYPGTVVKPAVRQMLVPAPGGLSSSPEALSARELGQWVRGVLRAAALAPIEQAAAEA